MIGLISDSENEVGSGIAVVKRGEGNVTSDGGGGRGQFIGWIMVAEKEAVVVWQGCCWSLVLLSLATSLPP